MGKYILKRLLTMIPVLLTVAVLIFILMYFVPGDPVQIMLGDSAASEEMVLRVREELGLDKSFAEQLVTYLADLLKLDFGKSYIYGTDVGTELIARFPYILAIPEKEMKTLRGKSISMIFQDPMTALNPVMTVVDQISESIAIHQNKNKQDARISAIKMLEMVGISADRADEYPHQFSGGMKQRVVIAIALACNPDLLIADEPTTALDVTIQAQVLELIGKLQKELGTSMILITHDLGVVAGTCDTVAVVYAGEIIEYGTKEDIFDHPTHPYTIGLFGALPDLTKNVKRLSPIVGLPPDPTVRYSTSCPFAARCPRVSDACWKQKPKNVEVSRGHVVWCLLAKEG